MQNNREESIYAKKVYDFIKKKNDKLPWWIVFYLVYNIKDTSKI